MRVGGKTPLFLGYGGAQSLPSRGAAPAVENLPTSNFMADFYRCGAGGAAGFGEAACISASSPAFFFFFGGGFPSPKKVNPRTLKILMPPRPGVPQPRDRSFPLNRLARFAKVRFSLAPPNWPKSSILKVVRFAFLGFFPQLFQARKTLMSPLFHYYYDYY